MDFNRTATPRAASWESAWDEAEKERTLMVAKFHAWLVQSRIETEKRLLSSEAHQKSIAPFARAGMGSATTPASVPLVVLEFAEATLQVMDLKRKMALLDVYYRQAAHNETSDCLTMEAGNEAEVNELWEQFLQSQQA